MKILSIIPAMDIGGAEVVVSTLVKDARERGHEVELASGGGFRADALVADGVRHLDLTLASRRPLDLLRSVARLRAAGRRGRPDLVHAHNVKAALIARLGLGRKIPVLVTFHGTARSSERMSVRILRLVADRVIAVSPHVTERLAECGLPSSRITTIENAVPDVPRHDRRAARRALDIADDATVVLCLARMVDQKRHDLLLAAWPRVAVSLGEDAVLLLAGDGPTRDALEVQARDSGAEASVRFLGARPDPDRLLAAADVLVLPTDWEGLPISLLEAMSVGIPVVVSRVGGVVETLGDAVRLVEPGSIEALADALITLLGDPAERDRLGTSGAALVHSRFGADRMLQRHDDTYRQLAAGTPEEN